MKYCRTFSLIFILGAVCWQTSCKSVTSTQRPNIILIMSDDHAKNAISCYNNRLLETPNIDRLANEGIRFDNAFVVNALCAPSRATMLTGKYSHTNGLRDNRDVFNPEQMTFPKRLQKAGYYTAVAGKWHLKSRPQGFDDWKILPGQGDYYNPLVIDDKDTLQITGYVTDIITNMAIDFLEKRDKNKPFCLLVLHKAPHRNWMPDTEHLNLFNDDDLPLPDSFFDDYQTRSAAAREQDMEIMHLFNSFDLKLEAVDESETNSGGNAGFNPLDSWKNAYNRLTDEQRLAWDAHYDKIIGAFRKKELKGKDLARWKYQRYIKDYLRCVVSVDENIGRLLNYLDKTGIEKNTLVIYTSDQGFFLGEHGWYDKRFMYEESAGIPLIVRYPREIKAGEVSQNLVLNLDFASTLLDYAGVSIPSDIQGRSMRPIFKGESPQNWREAFYYHYYEYPHGWHKVKRHYGIRTGRYKLIHFYNDIDDWELYDLATDPREMNNIYHDERYTSTIEDLKQKLSALQAYYKDDSMEYPQVTDTH